MRNSSRQRYAPVLCRGAFLLSALMLLAVAPAQAANKRDPNKEALRRMQIQVQQVEDKKAALEQDKAALGKELDTLKKKTGELTSSAARANQGKAKLEKEAEALRQDKAALSEQVAQLKQELGDSQKALHDTRQSLQQETGEKQRLAQNLTMQDKAVAICETKNQMLYRYDVELINRAQRRGSLEALLEVEPVLGLKRVQIENLLEEYRDKVDGQRVNSASATQDKAK